MKNRTALYYHFLEMKLRIMYIFLCIYISFFTCYYYYLEMIYVLTKPLLCYEKTFIFTDVTEAFSTSLQIGFFFSMYLALPLILYHTWCFYVPSKYVIYRSKLTFLYFLFVFLVFLSVMFTYFFILPMLYKFLLAFQTTNSLITIQLQAKIKSYVVLVCNIFTFSSIIASFGFIVFVCIHLNLLNLNKLLKNKNKIFFLNLILSSIISPADLFLQISITLLLMLIFEVFVIVALFYLKMVKFLH